LTSEALVAGRAFPLKRRLVQALG